MKVDDIDNAASLLKVITQMIADRWSIANSHSFDVLLPHFMNGGDGRLVAMFSDYRSDDDGIKAVREALLGATAKQLVLKVDRLRALGVDISLKFKGDGTLVLAQG